MAYVKNALGQLVPEQTLKSRGLNDPMRLLAPKTSIPFPKTPNVSNPIDASSLNNGAPLTPVQSTPTDYSSYYNRFKTGADGLNTDIQDIQNQVAAQTTQPLEQERSGLRKTLEDALAKITGRGQRQLDVQNEFGFTDNVKQLQEVNKRIVQSLAGFEAGKVGIEGKAIPKELKVGQLAQLERQRLAETGALTSIAQALQGNISLAQDTAKNVVDLEFGDEQQAIDNAREFIKLNYEDLTTAEKRRADETKVQLDERQNQLDLAKEEKANILAIAQSAAQNGADNLTLDKIINSKDALTATSAAGKFLQGKNTQVIEADGKKKLINTATGETIADLGSIAPDIQKIQDAYGNDILGVINPVTGQFERIDTGIEYNNPMGSDAYDTAYNIFNGLSGLKLTDVPTKQRTAVATELEKLKREAMKNGDVIGIMRGSAGGKEVDATTANSFVKAFNVIGQIASLQEIFSKEKLDKGYVNQQKEENGIDLNPIWGKVRSFNPWDMDAQSIKASLQAIVPNLARGIYGEVGVLTDNDIKNYSKTLPTLTSTEQVRQAVLGITIRSIQRSIENQVKVQAGLGRDVSGLVDIYNQYDTLATELLSGGKPPKIEGNFNNPGQLINKYPEAKQVIQGLLEQGKQYPKGAEGMRLMVEDINDYLGYGETSFNQVGGDTNSAITSLNLGGKNIQVDQSIAQKLAQADRDFFNATGQHLQINQSFRTREQQAKLYSELSKKGARVAPPGKSFHEKGLAIDVTNWKEAEKYLRRYGFKNNLADDKGHFSVGEFS